jgi:hypothetical protein
MKNPVVNLPDMDVALACICRLSWIIRRRNGERMKGFKLKYENTCHRPEVSCGSNNRTETPAGALAEDRSHRRFVTGHTRSENNERMQLIFFLS